MSAFAAGLIVSCLAYLAGSLPFGFLAARWMAGVDIRERGSGNIGATNVARVVGARLGLLVLLLDCLKGALPVLFCPRVFQWLTGDGAALAGHVQVACGIAAIAGHMFPCWLGFRGGKGVATALGVVLVLSAPATLAALAVFAATLGAFRIVSLASMLGSVGFCVAHLVLHSQPFSDEAWSLTAFSIAVPTLIIVRHHSNLRRLLKGEEPRFRAGPR